MVSNGTLLTKENAKKLRDLGVKCVQITIDGEKDIHDERRVFKNGGKTFDVIMQNIMDIVEIIKVNLNITIDSHNIESVERLYHLFNEHEQLKKLNEVRFSIVIDDDLMDQELQKIKYQEYSERIKRIVQKWQGTNVYIASPFESGVCPKKNLSHVLIWPDGMIYKCVTHGGQKNDDSCVGSIKDSPYLIISRIFNRYYHVDLKPKCKDCKILPMCNGGCSSRNKNGGDCQFDYWNEWLTFCLNYVDLANTTKKFLI
jgi:uncharacterized protein